MAIMEYYGNNGIPSQIDFDTHDSTYDENSDFSIGSGVPTRDGLFAAPVTGLYFFEANIYANLDIRYIYLMKRSASSTANAEIVPGSPFGIPRGDTSE